MRSRDSGTKTGGTMQTAQLGSGTKVVFVSTFLAIVLALCSTPCALAAVPIENFESNVVVNADGSAAVLENFELRGPTAGFEREIRTRFDGPFGNRHLLVDVVEVTDGLGKSVPYYTLQYPSKVTVRVSGGAGNTLKIIYGVRNAVRFGVDHDEFFWIATPAGQPITSANMNVTLPEAAAGQYKTQSYLRAQGGEITRTALWSYSGKVPLRADGTTINAGAPGPLAPGVSMILDVSMPSGILTPPHALVRVAWFLRANPVLLLPVVVLVIMLVLRHFKPRNAIAGRSIAPMYEPPQGYTPAEIGLLFDDRIDPRDISATLIDLAVRGYVKLEETKPQEGFFSDEPDYVIRLTKQPEEWGELAAHERTMLFHTFYGGRWTKLSSLRLRFPEIVPYMKADIMRALKVRGVYRVDPEAAQKWRQAGLFAVVCLLVLAQVAGIVALSQSWILSGISMALSAAIVYLLGRNMTAKSWRGMRAWTAARGFEEFLRTVEGDRLRRMQPGIFEKYLPYAMALGIEHRWTQAFEGIALENPQWLDVSVDGLFGKSDALDSIGFGKRLDFMFRQAILTVPRGRMPQNVAGAFGMGTVHD
ncbi:MAG TPA: DUF2207 domain-containing protein [Terriglobales bacterium]|nr:DUF2207 domain-containing protein [Terriglobales bacterium]